MGDPYEERLNALEHLADEARSAMEAAAKRLSLVEREVRAAEENEVTTALLEDAKIADQEAREAIDRLRYATQKYRERMGLANGGETH